eukprot:3106550-Heterocapsa_arctica.AAC.1
MGLGLTWSTLRFNRHAAPMWQCIGLLYAPSLEAIRGELGQCSNLYAVLPVLQSIGLSRAHD